MAVPQVRGGELVVDVGWLERLTGQIADAMNEVGLTAVAEAQRRSPRQSGATRRSVQHVVDEVDGSLYVFADHWDAGFSEFGTGRRGQATHGDRGAGDWPGGSPLDYSTVAGRPAQPFIRPAALAAVRRHFG